MKATSKSNMNKYSKNKSFIEKVKLHFDSQNVILLLLCLFIIFITCYPLIMIVVNSFYQEGAFTLRAYTEAFTSNGTYKALFNTFKLALGVLGLTWLLGGGLAFLCEKTDFKYKKIIRLLVFLSFTIPSYILSISWIEITSRGGYLNRILKIIFPNIDYSFNCYSLLASIIVLSIHLYPLIFFGISNALKKTGGILEKSGRLCGASSTYLLKTITLPLILPSFLSTGLLIISRTMANFGVVAQLALPVGKEVLTTRIYSAISELNLPLVCVLSILLMFISYLIFFITEKNTMKKSYYLKQTENSSTRNIIKLGKSKYFVNLLVFIFFLVCFIIPLITLLLSSFLKRWGLSIDFSNMTLNNYKFVLFENSLIKRAFLNSLVYGIFSASTACIIGCFIVYFYKHLQSKRTDLLMNVSQLPLSVPNMILAIGAIFAWIRIPFKLYGTKWIIIVTYIILFIPIVIKQLKGLAENIDNSNDMSARTLGVPIISRITKIFLPQIKRGITSGWIICFLIALREIPISLLLYAKGNETIGVMLFTIQSNSYGLEMTSAIAVIVIAISIVGNILIRKIGVRRLGNE